jgi:virginiamycin B lyase
MRVALRFAVVAAAVCAVALPAAPAAAAQVEELPAVLGALPGTHRPRFLAVGPEGAIWWTENGTEPGIGRITTAGVRMGRIPDPDVPVGIARAGDGTMYWTGEHGLGREPPGGAAEVVARPGFSEGLGFTAGGALRWGESGGGTEAVLGFAGESWSAAAVAVDSAAGGGNVSGMALGPGGRLWVAFPGRDELRLLDPAGLGPATVLGLPPGSGPTRLARGPGGELWVTMFDAPAIDRIAADGSRTRFPLPPGSGPLDIAAGPDGAMWFTEYGSNRVGRIGPDGSVAEYPIPTPAARPVGIVAGPDGALWIGESEAGMLGRIVPDPAPPGTGGSGGGGAAPTADTTAPHFLRPPRWAPRRFAAAGSGRSPAASRVAPGSRLRIALSEPAAVTVSIYRRGARRPLRTLRRATSGFGTLSLYFAGRAHGRPLPPGRYVTRVRARDAAGNASALRRAPFQVLPSN